jgi:hypothetical protein
VCQAKRQFLQSCLDVSQSLQNVNAISGSIRNKVFFDELHHC